jgi:hypothetical protein
LRRDKQEREDEGNRAEKRPDRKKFHPDLKKISKS